MFLATPHHGTDSTMLANTLAKLVSSFSRDAVVDTKSQLLSTVQANNETLQIINTDFIEICGRFQMVMARESKKTTFENGSPAEFIVDHASASPNMPGVTYFGIEATHEEMCKFKSSTSTGYLNIAIGIKRWVASCTEIIQRRWVEEDRGRTTNRKRHADEILGGFHVAEQVIKVRATWQRQS